MASLALWIQWEGDIDPQRWQRIVDAAGARCLHAVHAAEGTGWRAMARAARADEPSPLRRGPVAAGQPRVLLLDRAVGPGDPIASAALSDWTAERLADGTPTAAIMLDESSGTVTLFRDRMGQRNLVYARVPGGLIVASGDAVPLAHGGLDDALDLAWMAAYFVWLPCAHDETPFRSVRRVAPGETRVLTRDHDRAAKWVPEPDESLWALADHAIIERFRELLEHSVDAACRGARRVGISLSAGLDSAAVAAVGARLPTAPDARMLGITQGLAEWPEIDERALAGELAAAIGIEHLAFAADAMFPWCDAALRPVCPDTPHQTFFREWKSHSYSLFADHGVDVVLTGNFGDHLFAGADSWAIDAVRRGRAHRFVAGVRDSISRHGFTGLIHNRALRRVISEPLGRTDRLPARIDWLHPPLAEALRERLAAERRIYRRFPRMHHAELLLGADAAFDASGEHWFANHHGIEFRSPYRDPALVMFCLSIPADFSFRDGGTKWLLRECMRGRLPEAIRTRPKSSDLTPWESHAEERQREIWSALRGSNRMSELVLRPARMSAVSPDEQSFLDWFDLAAATWQTSIRT